MTVHFPLILKQWSIKYKNLCSVCLSGTTIWFKRTFFKWWLWYCYSTFVENGIINTFSPNFVLLNTFLNALVFAYTTFLSYIISILFKITIIFFIKSYAMIMHSAVWACIPFVISMIKNIRSMIWAPPIIVLIKDACPGQSTRVNCKYYYFI